MAHKKTFSVDALRDKVNMLLGQSTTSADYRKGAMAILEYVLFETGNYRGFAYLDVNNIPTGEKPGINISTVDGQILEDFEARFANTDRTRIYYR